MPAYQCFTMGTGCQLLELGTHLKMLCFLESFLKYPSIFQILWNRAQTSLRGGVGQGGKLKVVSVSHDRQTDVFLDHLHDRCFLTHLLVRVLQRSRANEIYTCLSPARSLLFSIGLHDDGANFHHLPSIGWTPRRASDE